MELKELLEHPKVIERGVSQNVNANNGMTYIRIGDFCAYSIILDKDLEIWRLSSSNPTGTTTYKSIQEIYDRIIGGKSTGSFKSNPSHWTL